MKRFVLFFCIVLLSVKSIAQKIIQMENVNGVYRITCSVNGAKMKMIFDTGASKVSLSETMANFLYDNGYISKEDVLGSSKSQIADGSIHNNVVINLKDLEISGLHIKNVQAVVISGQNAPLLLGQTAIQKLGRISLNGNKLIINDYEGAYSQKEIKKIGDLAAKYYLEGSDYASIDNWLKIIDYIDLSTYGYSMLTGSLVNTKQYEKCIEYGKEWERKYRNEEQSSYTSQILGNIGTSLGMLGDTKGAITYLEKCIPIDMRLRDTLVLQLTYRQLALFYYDLDEWDTTISYSKKALKLLLKINNTSIEEIKIKGINNESIGSCLYTYAEALYCKKERNSGDTVMAMAAKCNYNDAIDYCRENNINYNYRNSLFE